MKKTTTSWVKVSVIVPLYNVADFVATTIEQLQSQTLTEAEYIFIDDGSSDDTYTIVSTYAERDDRIRLIRQENQGPSAARNHGLRLAAGDYICFVDSDDVLSKDALELMYHAAIEEDADLVMGGTVRFNSRRTWYIKTYLDHGILEPGPKHITTHPGLMYAVGPCAKLYKRELIQGVFFPEHIRLGEDQPFALYAYVHAKKIYTIDAVVYFYRLREGESLSLTQQALSRPLDAFNDLYEMIHLGRDILQGHPRLFEYYLQRVISTDIWPRVKAAIGTGQGPIQAAAIDSFAGWMKTIDRRTFNKVDGLYYYPLAGLLYRVLQLKPPAWSSLWRLLGVILSKISFASCMRIVASVAAKLSRRFFSIMRKNVRLLSRKGRQLFLKKIVFGIAKALPAQKTVIFASNKSSRLTGNLKVLSDAVGRLYPDWQIHNYPQLEVERLWPECKRYYRMGRGAVIFLDDYYRQLYGVRGRDSAQIVQVWHAAGAFKKFGLSSLGAIDANPYEFEVAAHQSYTSVLTSSSEIRPLYAEAFHVPIERVLPLGVPRTDVFFDKSYIDKVKREFLQRYPQFDGKKILLYAPTFRGTPRQRVKFQLELNLELMANALGDEYVLLLKLHPSVKQGIQISSHLKRFVAEVSLTEDINDLLLLSDLLITDYSSVVFEYSLLNRPMLFFAYDLDSYLSERGFYYDYASFVPGPIVTTTTEIIDTIQRGDFNLDVVNAFADKFFDYRDGRATERILEHFLK